uniref:Uncharacterized protein n=2 Tax=Brassica oleracea var. oleracea TaxID=109376 RepID=A0A0D3DX12_BRAOL
MVLAANKDLETFPENHRLATDSFRGGRIRRVDGAGSSSFFFLIFFSTSSSFTDFDRLISSNHSLSKCSLTTARCFDRCDGSKLGLVIKAMALDGIVVSSPSRRTQSLKRQWEDLGSCSTVIKRHRYLLTALVLLAFLCTVYLYFAVTLGARHLSCSGLTGKEKAMCQLQHVQALSKGKLKFF